MGKNTALVCFVIDKGRQKVKTSGSEPDTIILEPNQYAVQRDTYLLKIVLITCYQDNRVEKTTTSLVILIEKHVSVVVFIGYVP